MENIVDETEDVLLNKAVEITGFDVQAGKSWIYPTNYPIRDYQYNIIQKALLTNTLVSLPTGLGKTFIAAVVMYNIYRWYPHGKLIFMAPTKPLVKQQIDACYNIMAIPPEVTAELTGAKISSARANLWIEKRVFFVTPQVLQNDLNKIEELGSKIKCLVFDEAHRARGNHAYCEVIRRLLTQNHKQFRVLALSATPGSNVNDVLEVIQNLLISHVEFRTEDSIDVAPYVFQRSLETVVVPLGKKIEEVRNDYYKILEPYVKTLIKFNIVQGNCGSLTKGGIYMRMKNFQSKNRGTSSSNYSEIMRCLTVCVTLYHGLELLIRHGLRNFLSFYDDHIEKPYLRGNTQLRCIINNVREYLGPIPNIEVLPDGTYPEIPDNFTFGHPKFYKLQDVLVSHFSQAEQNSRVIVFFEYRESVMEAHTLLLKSRPLIQSKIFLGQGSGITQKVQLGVVKAFREGRCNTLLSTCIGEEGLDVGEVDLIICFDISNKSPIRMVQRMGRTGRKREGRIVVLVTEGREQQTLKDCLIHKNNISTYVLESNQLSTGMYPDSPRLVPQHLTPRCEKIFITVRTVEKKKKSVKVLLLIHVQPQIEDMLKSLSNNSSDPVFSQEVKILNIKERIPEVTMFFNRGLNIYQERQIEANPIFYKFIEKQRAEQKTHGVRHSTYTKILTDLLHSADSKRFNLPTQVQSLTQGNASKHLKQSDIRNMFVKKNSQLDFQPTQTRTEVLKDIPTQILTKEVDEQVDNSDDSNIPKEVFALVSNYLFTQMDNPLKECRHCPHGFHCEDYAISSAPALLVNNSNWVPSEDILDAISLSDLENFTKSLDPTLQDSYLDEDNFSQMMDIDACEIFNNVNFTQLEQEAGINSLNVMADESFTFEAPKTYSNLLSKFGNSIFISQETTQVKKETGSENNKKLPENKEKSIFEFFMFESLSDIYGNSSPNSSQDTVIYSPNLSEIETNEENEKFRSSSPILSLSDRKRNYIARKVGKQRQVSNNWKRDYNIPGKEINSMDINDFVDLSSFGLLDSKAKGEHSNRSKTAGIEHICDLSQFGILPHVEKKQTKQDDDLLEVEDLKRRKISDIEQICDLSQFGLFPAVEKKQTKQIGLFPDIERKQTKQDDDLSEAKELNKGKITDIEQICDLSQFGIFPDVNKEQTKHDKHDTDLSGKAVNNNNEKNVDENKSDNDIFSQDELFQLSPDAHNKEHIDKSNVSCDKPYDKSSTPLENSYHKVSNYYPKSNYQKTTPPNISSVEGTKQTINDMDFNLPTQRTKKCDSHGSKTNNTQKSREIEGFALPSEQRADISVLSERNANMNINNGDLDFIEPTQRTDNSKKRFDKCSKQSLTQENSVIEDYEKGVVFAMATQPSVSNITNISTVTNVKANNNQILDDLTFTERSKNISKLNFTQRSSLIEDYEESEIFAMATQSNNSNKPNILATRNNICENKESSNYSAEEDEIECIDLTLSPTPTNEKCILSCQSQIPITQMLSLVNKATQKGNSQKENIEANKSLITSTPKVQSTLLNRGKSTWISKLSTKKNTHKQESLSITPTKRSPTREIDPYVFPINIKTNKKAPVEKGSTSSDEFEDSVFLKPEVSPMKPRKKLSEQSKKGQDKRFKRKRNDFLDLEAELSEDENINLSDDEDEENIDCYEKSFVDDETQNFDTQMHAQYLQSVRSPTGPGRFKIPVRPATNILDVYSQPDFTEMDTYLEDSFCVDADDNELTQRDQLSQLEILEKELKEKKRRKRSEKNDVPKPKRRRVICFASDDSD